MLIISVLEIEPTNSHLMKNLIVFIASTLILSGSTYAATCTSIGTGNWNTPSTWSCGTLPTGGDIVTVRPTDTVFISTVTNIMGPPLTITVHGVLMFDSSSSELNLPCNTVIIITPTGSIQTTGTASSNHAIRICRDNVWVGGDGTLSGPVIIGIILPIELVYFNAEYNQQEIDFSWQTASELDNDFFTIEGSTDGLIWIKMHQIEGAGSTQEVQNYALSSSNRKQFEYFRLKQTDFDGNFSYSDIVALPLLRDKLEVYPNPGNGRQLTINLTSTEQGLLQIFGNDGRVEYSKDLNGEKVLLLNDLNLTSGTYILRIQQLDEFENIRLVVQ